MQTEPEDRAVELPKCHVEILEIWTDGQKEELISERDRIDYFLNELFM